MPAYMVHTIPVFCCARICEVFSAGGFLIANCVLAAFGALSAAGAGCANDADTVSKLLRVRKASRDFITIMSLDCAAATGIMSRAN